MLAAQQRVKTIQIPRVTDSKEDFEVLFDITRRVHALRNEKVVFEFSKCGSLMQNGVCVLGGLTRLAQHQGCEVEFAWNTLSATIKGNLAKNGLMKFIGQEGRNPTKTTVPFRHDELLVEDDIVHYLYDSWIGTGRVNLSDALKNAIVGKACEIYVNAFDHSHSPVGVFTSGQYSPQRRQLKLSVVDFGVGIPDTVRSYLNEPTKSGAESMQWAFRRGNSSRKRDQANIARGLGLDLLREFVKINSGTLEIFSHDGEARIDDHQSFSSRTTYFPGTLVNITFRCDESYYKFASEASGKPLFS